MSAAATSVSESARHALVAELTRVRGYFESAAPFAAAPGRKSGRAKSTGPRAAKAADPNENRLTTLVTRFSLSAFERDVLLLCAGVEFDAAFADVVARAGGATFGLALAALPGAHWSALAPGAPLRHWRLVELAPGAGLTAAPLRIDERVLHFLAGVSAFEPRLHGRFFPVTVASELSPAQTDTVRAILDAWQKGGPLNRQPLLVLEGDDGAGHEALVAAASGSQGLALARVRADDLPVAPEDRVALARLWEREALLNVSVLLVILTAEDPEDVRERACAFADELCGLVVVSTPARLQLHRRTVVTLRSERPGASDQFALWQRALGPSAVRLNGEVERVAAQFQLDAAAIRRASQGAAQGPAPDAGARLWDACRLEARVAMTGLAQRIETSVTWDDLILPPAQKQVLHTIVAQVRQRLRVGETWGFARRDARGLGIHALFAGPSGTGKTLAAEVIARELSLDLHRIDLSALVSKYIGETEKNLRRVFDAAERGGSILLFDEADALFGKRSEVRDSHDRYANIEVSYLLQRIESYRGLALLTTNLKSALDPAFSRRLRFIVQFPFPDAAMRQEIWRRAFPADTPLEGLDFEQLARLSLSGGHIRNVALNAAYLAADAGSAVTMRHLLGAAQAEYAKLEKPLSEAEIAGWLS